jgi:hypothetical protein
VFVGVWLGCVITEALFERALLGKGREQELILARLHRRVDLFVEIPAFSVVLITGIFMFVGTSSGALLNTKIGFGLFAIAANIYCVRLVFRRATAAESDQWQEFSRLDALQHKLGAVVALGLLVALSMGVYLYAVA